MFSHPADEAFIVTTDDGQMFQCAVEEFHGEHRWIFTDTDREAHVGPKWTGMLLESQLRALVNAWWKGAKRGR